MRKMAAVVLAAGKGIRMYSELAKVLHPAAGRPLIHWVAAAAREAGVDPLVMVVGHQAEQVRAALGDGYLYALQEQQLGTAHALAAGLQAFPAALPPALLVLCGDTPLLTGATLAALRRQFEETAAACTVLTAVLPEGGNYGRILRDGSGNVTGIVEAKDATAEQLAVREINSGVYCFDTQAVLKVLDRIGSANAQGEYYLTDALAALVQLDLKVNALVCPDPVEISGVNDRLQLAAACRLLWDRKTTELMLSGVTILDPATVFIDASVAVGPDTVIEPNVYLHGKTVIGRGCHIGPQVKIVDSRVGDNCDVGPFCYLRPGTELADKVKAGHFVEIKKSRIGRGSKVPHLSYIGDAVIGEGVNIGCGTITCNYDGVRKHTTVIQDQVFIGSNVNLVPPLTVGRRSTVGAGSTITQDVPEDCLALARERQVNIEGWTVKKDPRFAKKDEKKD